MNIKWRRDTDSNIMKNETKLKKKKQAKNRKQNISRSRC